MGVLSLAPPPPGGPSGDRRGKGDRRDRKGDGDDWGDGTLGPMMRALGSPWNSCGSPGVPQRPRTSVLLLPPGPPAPPEGYQGG